MFFVCGGRGGGGDALWVAIEVLRDERELRVTYAILYALQCCKHDRPFETHINRLQRVDRGHVTGLLGGSGSVLAGRFGWYHQPKEDVAIVATRARAANLIANQDKVCVRVSGRKLKGASLLTRSDIYCSSAAPALADWQDSHCSLEEVW